MNKMLWLCLCIVLVLDASPVIAVQTIRLAVVTKPGSAQNIVAEKFQELVKERAGDRFEVKIFHSGSLGNETEILQQIQLGTVEMGIITSGPFDSFDPIVRVIDYPFIFTDHQQADQILDGPLGAEILASLESSGFKGLCFSENGFRNLTNDRQAVNRPEDVRGLKIRVMSSALHKAIWQSLGANPTPMGWPIYTELEQGVIDGQENPLWVIEVYKLYEIQKHLSLTRHVYSAHIDVASLGWWQGLAAADQELLLQAMCEAARYQRAHNREGDAGRLLQLKEMGMAVVEEPDLTGFRAKTADLQALELFADPKVQDLLQRVLAATR